jgi:hypothetical protein
LTYQEQLEIELDVLYSSKIGGVFLQGYHGAFQTHLQSFGVDVQRDLTM